MPELAEVKLTSDYINKYRDKIFTKIGKSHVSKINTPLSIPFDQFKIVAESRGKELMLNINPIDTDQTSLKLRITLGMSGEWKFYPATEEPDHVHLFFEAADGNRLGMRDVRRFGRWSWGDFNSDRGNDPLTEYEKFSNNIIANYKKNKDFKKPICEVLMNQRWFNGIGNYLRAEILYRANVDPFILSCDLSLEELQNINLLCNSCVSDSYILGGGQLKDWKNPEGISANSFKDWMKCYGKLSSITDSNGRNFWYDPKWTPKNIKIKKPKNINNV